MRHRYFTTSLTVDVYSESVCLWSLMNNVFNLFTVHTTVYHTSTKNSVRDPNLKCTMTESKLILLSISYHSTEKYNSPQTHISPFKQHTSKREVPLNLFSNSKMCHHHFISLPHTWSSFFPFHQTFFSQHKVTKQNCKVFTPPPLTHLHSTCLFRWRWATTLLSTFKTLQFYNICTFYDDDLLLLVVFHLVQLTPHTIIFFRLKRLQN